MRRAYAALEVPVGLELRNRAQVGIVRSCASTTPTIIPNRPEKQKTATELTQKLTEGLQAARTPAAEIEHQPPSARTQREREDTEPGAGVGAHAIRTSTVAPFLDAEIFRSART